MSRAEQGEAAWLPEPETASLAAGIGHTNCQCGGLVSQAFSRVFDTAEAEVYACFSCATHAAIKDGAAAQPDGDGTLRVHRPGADEPVPVVESTDPAEQTATETEPVQLNDVDDPATPDQPDDPAFANLAKK
jgi:hypothetical protein